MKCVTFHPWTRVEIPYSSWDLFVLWLLPALRVHSLSAVCLQNNNSRLQTCMTIYMTAWLHILQDIAGWPHIMDRKQRRPDVRRNTVDTTARPADNWQQNADVALMQSQRLERSEQPSTEEQYRSDSVAWSCRFSTWHAQVRRANEARHVSATHMTILPLVIQTIHYRPHSLLTPQCWGVRTPWRLQNDQSSVTTDTTILPHNAHMEVIHQNRQTSKMHFRLRL